MPSASMTGTSQGIMGNTSTMPTNQNQGYPVPGNSYGMSGVSRPDTTPQYRPDTQYPPMGLSSYTSASVPPKSILKKSSTDYDKKVESQSAFSPDVLSRTISSMDDISRQHRLRQVQEELNKIEVLKAERSAAAATAVAASRTSVFAGSAALKGKPDQTVGNVLDTKQKLAPVSCL